LNPEPSSPPSLVGLDAQRQQVVVDSRCVIVKVGTRVLTNATGQLDLQRIGELSAQLCHIASTGRQTILVSSGAVGAGLGRLGLTARPSGLAKLQAVAAIGQSVLIQAYEAAMAQGGYHAAQVLLTAEDLRHRTSYLNVRNALSQIHELGAIAIINENDSVAVEELMTTFGDNDRLAAAVSGLTQDTLMIILSDIDGLMDGPPSASTSRVISTVDTLDETIWDLVQAPVAGQISKGGMASKLHAAAKANAFGHPAIIASGRCPDVLRRLIAGEPLGTLFLPSTDPLRGRRRWIGGEAAIAGQVHIDAGAAAAILAGNSLLAIGITHCTGDFQRGDCVEILDPWNAMVARGLTNYSTDELTTIAGLPSDKIVDVLGRCPHDAVVHRDNMAVGADEITTDLE